MQEASGKYSGLVRAQIRSATNSLWLFANLNPLLGFLRGQRSILRTDVGEGGRRRLSHFSQSTSVVFLEESLEMNCL